MIIYAWIIIVGLGLDILYLLLSDSEKLRDNILNKRIPNFIVYLPFVGRVLGWW